LLYDEVRVVTVEFAVGAGHCTGWFVAVSTQEDE
jgi:hypothetical protein